MSQSDIVALVNCGSSLLLLIVTIISVVCAFKAYRHQKERARKEAACQLARIYADEILLQYQIVSSFFGRSKLLEFIKATFPMDEFSSFTLQEMLELALRAHITVNDLTAKMEDFDPLCILDVMARATTSVHDRDALYATYSEIDESSGVRIPKNSVFLRFQFGDTISHLLNTLEWFSMNCRYGLADEEVLYQSIHQTFLSTVWMLYYYISKNNTKNEDKFYTNTIWLFQKWKARLSEQTQIAAQEQQEALTMMETAKKQYNNAGSNYTGKILK